MSEPKTIKEKLLVELDSLPESRLEEVLTFVNHLKAEEIPPTKLNLNKDPLLEFIGSIEHGALAQDIDKELYGE